MHKITIIETSPAKESLGTVADLTESSRFVTKEDPGRWMMRTDDDEYPALALRGGHLYGARLLSDELLRVLRPDEVLQIGPQIM